MHSLLFYLDKKKNVVELPSHPDPTTAPLTPAALAAIADPFESGRT